MSYRWIGLCAAALLAAGLWDASAGQPPAPRTEAKDSDADLIKRGEYLVNEVAHCSHCHTPQTDKGELDRARLLQGATLPIRPKKETKNWEDESPDITHGGVAGKWSEAAMIKFLRTGENPDGMKPTPPMPVFHLHEDDARAVTLYLRSLPGAKGKGAD
jgi:hypothetical protein